MEVTFYFNKDCNWNCDYCNQKLMNKSHKKTDEQLLKDFEYWLSECTKYFLSIELCLCGGEPGLWSENFVTEISNIINKYSDSIHLLQIFTNGTLFKNKRFLIIKNDIKVIYAWHCTSYIKDVKIEDLEYEEYAPRNSTVSIIIRKEDIKYLDKFLSENDGSPLININLAQKSEYTSGVEDFSLEDYNTIINIMRKHKNVNTFWINSINSVRNRWRTLGTESVREMCKKQREQILIDLVEDVIFSCCGYRKSIPLTSENIINKSKIFSNMDCGNCVNDVAYYVYGEASKCRT